MAVSSAMQRRAVFICILFFFLFLPQCVSLRSGHCRETHRNCELAELANNYHSPCPNIIKSLRLNHNSIIMLTCVSTTPSLCCSSVHREGSILTDFVFIALQSWLCILSVCFTTSLLPIYFNLLIFVSYV